MARLRAKALHTGLDYFSVTPGTVTSQKCKVCGDDCNVQRNKYGPTSFAGSLARMKQYFDAFTCPNIGTDWHNQAVCLMMEAKRTASRHLSKILLDELAVILRTREPTKKDELFHEW